MFSKNGQSMLENYFFLENVDKLSKPQNTQSSSTQGYRCTGLHEVTSLRRLVRERLAFNYKMLNDCSY